MFYIITVLRCVRPLARTARADTYSIHMHPFTGNSLLLFGELARRAAVTELSALNEITPKMNINFNTKSSMNEHKKQLS